VDSRDLDQGRDVHSDFYFIERGSEGKEERLSVARQMLRNAWVLPTDTFVTTDMPLLLTALALPPSYPNGYPASQRAGRPLQIDAQDVRGDRSA
jgi:hypothetical protein